MTSMKTIYLLTLAVLLLGCYDFKDGSTATVLTGESGTNLKYDGTLHTNNDRLPEFVKADACDNDASFAAIKSGDICDNTCDTNDPEADSCYDRFGCGVAQPPEAAGVPSSRFVECMRGSISATNVIAQEEAEPRPDVVWTDCSALADGRSGEKCEGVFSCYTPLEGGCIERVSCGDNLTVNVNGSSVSPYLVRYLLCDDSLLKPMPSIDVAHTNCGDATSSVVGDECTGNFLCEGIKYTDNNQLSAVDVCQDADGYCREGDALYSDSNIVWCDNGRTRILSSVIFAIPYLLGLEGTSDDA
ncbi:MAG: hypothetical protein JXR76_22560 [Deltaproteobacteria bacterium]|nr:hypothetical protein [Deltaproteobacteria bacterium]